jgi:glycerophosphoryl diester phosphodiesterase/phosphoglycerol transferase MdoB-like AlkP superfamily enzyme
MDTIKEKVFFIMLWSFGFAALAAFMKTLIFIFWGYQSGFVHISNNLFLSIPGQMICGLIPACFHVFQAVFLRRFVFILLSILFVIINIFSFFYESFFGYLPGQMALHYIFSESVYLGGSLKEMSYIFFGPLIIIINLILLSALTVWLRRITPGRFSTSRYLMAILLLTLSASGFLLHRFPLLHDERIYWATRAPFLWLLQSTVATPVASTDAKEVSLDELRWFQSILGHQNPFAGENPFFPLCKPEKPPSHSADKKRSVVILILESVGLEELNYYQDRLWLMPRLREIAEREIHFPDIMASGTRSVQALPALFSGLPPQRSGILLWIEPMRNIDGFPSRLSSAGYETAYFHGGNLAFENQLAYLKIAGFQHVEELKLDLDSETYGWGYPDGKMFDSLKGWIVKHRSETPNKPYMASLFTLSTHHPFNVPEDWEKKSGKPSFEVNIKGWPFPFFNQQALARSYEYLDEMIWDFYQWFQKTEAARGTILILVGDHGGLISRALAYRAGHRVDTVVPLIIANVPSDEKRIYRQYADRKGALFDLPSTLGQLLDIESNLCDQGIDLFQPETSWPQSRVVYSVVGDNLEIIHAWKNDNLFSLNLITNDFKKVDIRRHKTTRMKDYRSAAEIIHLVNTFSKNCKIIFNKDIIAPATDQKPESSPVRPFPAPRIISHRGNVNGIRPPGKENTLKAIEEAVSAGFRWVEVDLNVTKDGIPILIHDPIIEMPSKEKLVLCHFTLDELRSREEFQKVPTLEECLIRFGDKVGFLFDLKAQPYQNAGLDLIWGIIGTLKKHPPEKPYVFDTLSNFLGTTLIKTGRYDVGYDIPFEMPITEKVVDAVWRQGYKWIYVDLKRLSPEIIEYAHSIGMRVLVYTVNAPEDLKKAGDLLPDAIITDHQSMLDRFAHPPH